MAIRLVHNSWWIDFRHEGVRYRKRSPENSKKGATEYERHCRSRLARNEEIFKKKEVLPSFEKFAKEWLATYVETNNKPSERRTKRLALRRHLVPWFGKMPINQISSFHIEKFKAAKIKEGLAPKTVNNLLAILSKCLKTAQEWLDLSSVPKLKLLKVPPQKYDFLQPEESKQLLDDIQDAFWRTMVLVALKTGLRLCELIGLDWDDVDLRNKTLAVRRGVVRGIIGSPKNNKMRYIPLTSDICVALTDLKGVHTKAGFVFSLNGNKFLNRKTPHVVLSRLCRSAGLRHIGWHTLRHTFASHLVVRGVSIKAVQELLGHSDLKTTLRYAHLAPSALRSAIDTLENDATEVPSCFGQPVVNSTTHATP